MKISHIDYISKTAWKKMYRKVDDILLEESKSAEF